MSEVKPKPEGYVFGRPTEYKPEYCQMLIDHMVEGFSFETFGAIVDCCKDTLYKWVQKHPDFADAKKRAFIKSQLHWEKIGKDGLWNEPFERTLNTGNYVFQMKNRFRWTDRIEDQPPKEDRPKRMLAYERKRKDT